MYRKKKTKGKEKAYETLKFSAEKTFKKQSMKYNYI